jgi:hypothetical protein
MSSQQQAACCATDTLKYKGSTVWRWNFKWNQTSYIGRCIHLFVPYDEEPKGPGARFRAMAPRRSHCVGMPKPAYDAST